jgi:hypothetical protein
MDLPRLFGFFLSFDLPLSIRGALIAMIRIAKPMPLKGCDEELLLFGLPRKIRLLA